MLLPLPIPDQSQRFPFFNEKLTPSTAFTTARDKEIGLSIFYVQDIFCCHYLTLNSCFRVTVA